MKKTSIYLDPDIDRALARLARERGLTKAEMIRRALADAVGAQRRPRIRAIGIGAGGPGDVADNVDRYLEGFGEV